MKKKYSQDYFYVENNQKKVERMKSPLIKKIVKKEQQNSRGIKNKYFSRQEDSNNTTACTKGKLGKPAKKLKAKKQQKNNQHKIFQLIQVFAIKIQRQWRIYLFRKNWKKLIHSIRQKNRKTFNGPSKLLNKGKFIQEQVQQSENSRFNSKKYQSQSSSLQSINNSRTIKSIDYKKKSQKQIIITPRQFNQGSLQKIQQSKSKSKSLYTKIQSEDRRATFSGFQFKNIQEIRRHSTGQVKNMLANLKIDKAYNIHIQNQSKQKYTKNTQKQWSPSEKRGQDENTAAFRQRITPNKLIKKYKQDLQMCHLKKLLSIQNRYQKNEFTQRRYQDMMGKLKQQHDNKLIQIKQKQSKFKQAWGQLLKIYHTNKNIQQKRDKFIQQNNSQLDLSISFDKWQFNSSIKKSFQILQLPDNGSNKTLSIQRVLRQLDQQQQIQNKKFKKNKSLQQIQAIAERSKQISDQDISQYQIKHKQQIKISQNQEAGQFTQQINQKLKISIESKPMISFQKLMIEQNNNINNIIQYQNKILKDQYCTPQISLQDHVAQTQQQDKQKRQEYIQKQYSPHKNTSTQKQRLKHLLINDIDGGIYKKAPQIIQYNHIIKIAEKVFYLQRCKQINTLKTWIIRANQLFRRAKNKTNLIFIPKINSQIDTVNTWLLQISHHILDYHQQIIKQNLIRPKQPSEKDLMNLVRLSDDNQKVYPVIPEYIFKQFQKNYIQNQWNNSEYYDQESKKSYFVTLTYDFNRSLIDALNLALMEEMDGGKNWMKMPWKTIKNKPFKLNFQQVKICLQKSINVVSHWAEYGLGRLQYSDESSELQGRNYERQKIELVSRQQVHERSLNYHFSEAHCKLQLAQQIQKLLINQIANQLIQF